MKSKVNILIAVDVIGALSDKTLGNDNLIMMDNSIWPSTAQGTPNLCTLVQYGQQVNWTVYAVDLQTPVAITGIRFFPAGSDVLPEYEAACEAADEAAGGAASGAVGDSDRAHLNVWSGVVPAWMVPGIDYRYRLTVQMYEGVNSVMHIDTPSLRCI